MDYVTRTAQDEPKGQTRGVELFKEVCLNTPLVTRISKTEEESSLGTR